MVEGGGGGGGEWVTRFLAAIWSSVLFNKSKFMEALYLLHLPSCIHIECDVLFGRFTNLFYT